MKCLPISASLLLATLILFAGCQSVDDRIRDNPDAYAKLDLETREKVRQGIIELGFSEDAVYLALGKPDQTREKVTADGKTSTWVYNSYYERYDGTHLAGYHRNVYYDPHLRAYRVYYRPVYADTYSREREERIRVVFRNGQATVIEQMKD